MTADDTARVWTIEAGQYSDYHIIGIYSTQANAEKVLATLEHDPYDNPHIKERTLDPYLTELNEGLGIWYVLMDPNGDVRQCKPVSTPDSGQLGGGLHVTRAGPVHGWVWARDAGHAVKIVNDFRTQHKANQ